MLSILIFGDKLCMSKEEGINFFPVVDCMNIFYVGSAGIFFFLQISLHLSLCKAGGALLPFHFFMYVRAGVVPFFEMCVCVRVFTQQRGKKCSILILVNFCFLSEVRRGYSARRERNSVSGTRGVWVRWIPPPSLHRFQVAFAQIEPKIHGSDGQVRVTMP